MSTAKILIPNKEWLVTENEHKLGTISKEKKGYSFLRKGKSVTFKSLSEIKETLGIIAFEESIRKSISNSHDNYAIYDFPCNDKPFDPIYSLKQRLPIFSKGAKSKSKFCAGYYLIKFRAGWKKSFCPKLITLERYPYHGPFKTDEEVKSQLIKINKHEIT